MFRREGSQRLRLAKEGLALTAGYKGHEGWYVVITSRRQGEKWDEGEQTKYEALSSAELLDVLYLELERHITG